MRAPGFTGAVIDRADWMRHDEAALANALRDPKARLLGLDDLDPVLAEDRLTWTMLADQGEAPPLVLLGLIEGVPHFAPLDPPRSAGERPGGLFDAIARLPESEAALYAGARSVVDWHRRHRFCARCGHATHTFRAGWARKCDNCDAEHFPRTDPVVIMIAEHDGRALLGRQASWAPGRYSALAGFLEPGESIEEAVARETLEESGVRVTNVRYVASQPWPFPSSLMIACVGQAADDRITVDTNEIEDARWFARDEVRAALAGEADAPFGAPPPIAIAHTLLSAWAEAGS
ncbi:NAD(+) diphosphatase [Stakelama tenebrarum]|uniref:NAD(+) diphosphatase n=1 Tax=Stakelama tenebrarum TaxID=2711215 RepID=A0A6G6Y0L8_9SPHN|nr:NAD(+) diphosphatase [Sphingosinithalassobacter tenebrarum]QIG78449.1 NAD(+) diphosphatase [Sphingosinithalassobacter tenebrarum]